VTTRIRHNPRCSKSRATLALLQDNGIQPEVRLYLEDPPSDSELREVLKRLGRSPRELLRRGEDEYRALGLAEPGLANDAIVEAMAGHPRLIERPVVLHDGKAALGRPPEAVLELF
jgi:arsenate reductase